MLSFDIFSYLREYLASSSLGEKDRLLRQMRWLVESGPPDREEFEVFRLQKDSGETLKEDPEKEALLLLLAGYNRMAGYDHPGAEEAYEKVIPQNAGEQHPPLLYISCCAGLGRVLSLSERGLNLQAAELHFQRALARKTRLGDLHGLAYTLGNLGRYFASQERDDLATHYLQRELELCEELGNLKGRMVSLRGLARIAWRAGQWSQALDYLKRVEGLVRQVGSRFTEAHLCHTRADYHLARGEWDQAEPLHQKARDLFGPQPGDLTQAQLELQTAQIAAGRGDQIQAE